MRSKATHPGPANSEKDSTRYVVPIVDSYLSRRSVWLRAIFLTVVILACPFVLAAQTGDSNLFSPARMTEFKLKGLRVRLGQPVQVTAQLGWQMRTAYTKKTTYPTEEWAFVHAVSTMASFPKGELIVTYTMVPDTNDNPFNLSGFQISRDAGETWGPRSTIIAEHQSMIYVPEDDDSLMAIPSYLYQRTPGDERNFRAAYTRFEDGGRRVVIEPDGLQVVDWPWAAELIKGVTPPENWLAGLFFDGNAIRINGHLIASAYFEKKGETVFSSVILASEDDGHTWRYFSTVADPSMLPASPKNPEGPNEISMIQLADGDLMAVFRAGGGPGWPLWRAYSNDGGRTWSKPESLQAQSAEPRLKRIANGTILLSTGRPGIFLWLSTDVRATNWQSVDIGAHHNRWARDPSYRISAVPQRGTSQIPDTTTSYTQMVEVAPNRLLMVYDRSPEAKPVNAKDLTRIFVLPIEVERD
jgi:hypothetical protein